MRTDNLEYVKHLLLCMDSDIAFIEKEHGTKNLYGAKRTLKHLHKVVDRILVGDKQ